MSTNLPEQHNSEEVDLGQLFKLIGKAFNRLFKFIGSILNGLFLAFVWLVFFLKKHAIKMIVAAIIGFGYGYFNEKIVKPKYLSSVMLKQNYDTGKNLYELIEYYNELIKDNDSSTLKNEFNISLHLAASIKKIEINPNVTETQLVKNYDDYIKGLDSALASKIDYETYYESINFWEFEEQQVSIISKEKANLNPVFENIVERINNTEYFKRENEKDINELNNREAALKQALVKSDSLINMYKRVLEMPLDKTSGAQTSITIEGSDQIDKTKEYELYKSELEIRRELVQIERDREDKEQILEIISNKQDIAVLDTKIKFLKIALDQKIFYLVVFGLITLVILLFLNFIKFLERFRDKI